MVDSLPPDLSALKIPELKALLKARGLPVSGNKAALVLRLQRVVVSAPAASNAPFEEPQTKKIRLNTNTLSNTSHGSEPSNLASPAVSKVTQQPAGPLSLLPTFSHITTDPKVQHSQPVRDLALTSSASLTFITAQATRIIPISDVSQLSNSLVPPPQSGASIPKVMTPSMGRKRIVVPPFAAPATSAHSSTIQPMLNTPASKNQCAIARLPKARLTRLSPLFTRPTQSTMPAIIDYLRSSWLERFWRLHAKSRQDEKILLFDAISPRLFTSPDHPHQFNAALTFVISRLYFSIATCEEAITLLQLPQVIDCTPVVTGIWLISLEGGEKMNVIESTGEVIGAQDQFIQPIAFAKTNPAKVLTMRADWSRHIEEVKNGNKISLLDLVQSSDPDDYPSGISWSCCQKIQADPELLRVVASFILSQCTPNSISGEWSSIYSEAQIANATPMSTLASSTHTKLGFYLPPTQHVESVHLLPHQDIAVVQTTSRGQYVLRATGQVIGSEEEGISVSASHS